MGWGGGGGGEGRLGPHTFSRFLNEDFCDIAFYFSYRLSHSNIKFISSHHRVISSIYLYSNILRSQAKYSEVSTARNIPLGTYNVVGSGGSHFCQSPFLIKMQGRINTFFEKKKKQNSSALPPPAPKKNVPSLKLQGRFEFTTVFLFAKENVYRVVGT